MEQCEATNCRTLLVNVEHMQILLSLDPLSSQWQRQHLRKSLDAGEHLQKMADSQRPLFVCTRAPKLPYRGQFKVKAVGAELVK